MDQEKETIGIFATEITETEIIGIETTEIEISATVNTKIGIIGTVKTEITTVTTTVTVTVITVVVNEMTTVTGTTTVAEVDMVVDTALLIILTIEFPLLVCPKAVPGKTLRIILDKLEKYVLRTYDVTAPEKRLVSLSSNTRMI